MILREQLTRGILNLPRYAKQIIAMLCDLSLCIICVVAAYYLRLDQVVALKGPVIIAAFISIFIALPNFWLMGLYHTIFRYSGLSIIFSVSVAVLVYGSLYFCVITLYGIKGVPRSIGILQPMLLLFGVVSSRLFTKFIIGKGIKKKTKSSKITLIYGAGSSGTQLVNALINNNKFKVVGFLDDDERIQGHVIQGYKVYNTNKLETLVKSKDIELVLLAIPSVSRFKRNQILKKLKKANLIVHTLPSITDIAEGKINVSDIRELDVSDILEREVIPPYKELLTKNIFSKNILITGAGGSIGSELCRQIIRLKPKALILCEISEFALYKISEELSMINKNSKIVPLICNIQDENKINEVLKTFKVDTIYHSAAYKHVPLVEKNICEGVLNNVFGTYAIVRASIQQNVSNFVLISSDKAVRSTNIMGASKRLAEICVQALYHQHKDIKTNMSMVRFGNVLESSGSVIPKFKQQIKQGGPITLTHPDVTRFFMTTTEAAQLVIQAGAMSENCDVFVLDMGKSVKIKDLIYRIVNLSGLKVKDEQNLDGDIEIDIIGLRPGEKLYEELLIGNNPQSTFHQKIKKAQDPFIPLEQLDISLNILKKHLIKNDAHDVKLILKNIVSSYNSEYEIVDHIYVEKEYLNKSKNNKRDISNKVVSIKK